MRTCLTLIACTRCLLARVASLLLLFPALALSSVLGNQERLPGLAQIAETYFKAPRILPVELLVFEDEPGCFGLIWSSPMDNFSFFVKQPSLL